MLHVRDKLSLLVLSIEYDIVVNIEYDIAYWCLHREERSLLQGQQIQA